MNVRTLQENDTASLGSRSRVRKILLVVAAVVPPPFSPAARETPLTPLSALNEAMMASQLGAVDSGYPRLTVGGRSDGLHVGNRICTGRKEHFKVPENALKFRQFVKQKTCTSRTLTLKPKRTRFGNSNNSITSRKGKIFLTRQNIFFWGKNRNLDQVNGT